MDGAREKPGPAEEPGTTEGTGTTEETGTPVPRVALWTRVDCHLCDEARRVVREVCGQTGDSWVEVDVDGDERRRREWTDKVPVVTVDGTVVDFWRVDPVRLRDRLTGRRTRWRAARGREW